MLDKVLQRAVELSASDILIIAGLPVSYKVNGRIVRDEADMLLPNDTLAIAEQAYAFSGGRKLDKLMASGDDDFSFSLPGMSRFRVNALKQRGSIGLVIRVVSFSLPDREKLGIPDTVMSFSDYKKGLILFTGSAGSGKSTTLACIVDRVNNTKNSHIITIEDPIEYLHRHKQSIVTQRELATDTSTYSIALRAALREAPDMILLGEMRDEDTIRAAVTAAETGHLVISTLHTLGAANTIDRIIDAFPPEQQQQIRTQLALVLEGVVSQQLLPTVDGKLAPAFEVMTVSSAVRNMIRESKAHQLDSVISSSADAGMISMDQSILALVKAGRVSADTAIKYAVNPDWLKKRLAQ